MADPLALYLGLVAATFVVLAGAYAYYQADAMPSGALPAGLTPRAGASVTVATLAVVIGFGFLGDVAVFDPETDVRGLGMAVIGASIPLVLGFAGLASCQALARRWRRLHPDHDGSTGSCTTGTVACSGPVTDAAVGRAPVTDREACCWSWSAEVRDPFGVEGVSNAGEQWVVREGGVGGVRFCVDDGSGPVWVDPEGATMDLGDRRQVALAADERPPDSFPNPAPDVERTHRDKRRRYEESIVVPGDHVAIAGMARETGDGIVLADDVHVAAGTLETVASRYRNRATLYGVAGLGGVAVGLWALAAVLGVG